MKMVIISGTGEIQTAIAYGMSRLGFNVVITDVEVDVRKKTVSKVRSLGGKIHSHATSLYDVSWSLALLVVSNKLFHSNFCRSKNIRFAEMGGNIRNSQKIANDALENKFPTVFRNLGLVPDWAERMKRVEGDMHWTKLQKVLGFPAAAAATCFALGHFDQNKSLVSYGDITPLSYQRNLKIIEGHEPVWRGTRYDE